MHDLDDKEDYQVHRNAWVKEHGTKRGFNSHNYKRYGFANEAGLRRHIGRREATTREANQADQKNSRARNNGTKRNRDNIRQTNRGRDQSSSNQGISADKLEYHQHLNLSAIRRIKYGTLEPTGYISDLSDLR